MSLVIQTNILCPVCFFQGMNAVVEKKEFICPQCSTSYRDNKAMDRVEEAHMKQEENEAPPSIVRPSLEEENENQETGTPSV